MNPQLESWFPEAVDLARLGQGLVEPNPMVGALALQGEDIVGRGWHARFGGAHAEEAALLDAQSAGHTVDGLVVTLEPCSSEPGTVAGAEKRRSACTSLIREAKIRRVFVGALDPDPRHRGAGLEVLRGCGIQVEGPYDFPVLEGLLTQFERGLVLDRPWVQAKWAMTLDGKTASRTGSSRWISGEEALRHAHELRAAADAVLVGMGTVLTDDPSLDVRHVVGADPIAIVLDPRCEIPLSSRLVARAADSEVWLWAADTCPPERRREREQMGLRIHPVPEVAGQLDLRSALRHLRGLGIRRLLVEGGGKLLGQLFDAQLLDQCETILAPKLIGGFEALAPIAGTGLAQMESAVYLEDSYSRPLGDCLLFGGYPRFGDSEG